MNTYQMLKNAHDAQRRTIEQLLAENARLQAQAKETRLEIGVRDGMINNLQAENGRLLEVLGLCADALNDPRIGTYDQDSIDWYEKVDAACAAIKKIGPPR